MDQQRIEGLSGTEGMASALVVIQQPPLYLQYENGAARRLLMGPTVMIQRFRARESSRISDLDPCQLISLLRTESQLE